MRRLWRPLIWLLILGGGTAAGIWWWRAKSDTARKPRREAVIAERGDLFLKVSSVGSVEPEYTVEIKSKASGTVKKVYVQEGARVKKGKLLVRIDPILERRKVTQAIAELRMAKAQVKSIGYKRKFAKRQLAREEGLLKKGLVSRETVELSRKEAGILDGEAEVAAAQVLRARETLREAQDRLSETKIRAPITGTVLERTVNPGQIVSSGTTTVTGGTTLLKIANLDRLFVRVKVDEADVARVHKGMKVRITADALAGRSFVGTVLRVAPQGKVENNVVVFDVLVEAGPKGRKALRPVMTSNVTFVVAERHGVVLLPFKAVRRQFQSRKHFVELEGGAFREVRAGLTDGRAYEIIAGVKEGERVLLPPPRVRVRRGRGRRKGGPSGWQMRRTMGMRR